MKIAFIAKGYHPPWCEGGRNVLRGWTFILFKMPKFKFKVYSFVDWGLIGDPVLNEQLENTLLIDSAINKVCGLVSRYLFSHNFIIQASYNITSILQTITSLAYSFDHLKEYDFIHLHNVSYYFFINKLKKEIKKLSVTIMSSDHKSVVGKSYLKKIRKIIVTSPIMYYFLAKNENLKHKVHLVLPLPLLPSLMFFGHKQNEQKKTIYIELLNEIKDEFNYVLLYVGGVNQYRFPLKLFAKLLSEIKKQAAFLLIITPPAPYNINYLHKMNTLIKKYKAEKNTLIIADNISPYEKEKILDLADVFIFPVIKEDIAIDPPLSIVEALIKDVYVLSSNIGSTSTLIKIANFGRSLDLFQSDKGYEAFIMELKRILKNEEYYGKSDKALKELFSVKNISLQLKEAFSINN